MNSVMPRICRQSKAVLIALLPLFLLLLPCPCLSDSLSEQALDAAVEDINTSMAGTIYPTWNNREPASVLDAMCSYSVSGERCTNILDGDVLSAVPGVLWDDVAQTTNYVCWTNVVDAGITNGRFAYLVVNCSGLLDANYAGGAQRIWSTNIDEIDLSGLPDIVDTNAFYSDRTAQGPYQTIAGLGQLNAGVIDPVSNLFVHSYDPGRDAVLEDRSEVGQAAIGLANKFYLHSITNYAGYSSNDKDAYRYDPIFMNEYYEPLVGYLKGMDLMGPENSASLFCAEDVAWNIINYLDTNRIPQTGHDGEYPWQHTEGVEAVPLINEVVLQKASPDGPNTNRYEFVVETWFPFYPVDVQPEDNFLLQVGVFTNNWEGMPSAPSPLDIMDYADPTWSYMEPITQMVFGTTSEFLCFTSPVGKEIYFEDVVGATTNYLPLGAYDSQGKKCSVWFLARVLKIDSIGAFVVTNIVEEAMGYDPYDEEFQLLRRRALLEFTETRGYSVNDPRSNGQRRYWAACALPTTGTNYPAAQHTLGTMNVNCDPWTRKGQGLPIYFSDDLMKSIGEIGNIFASALKEELPDPEDWWWQTVNLLNHDEGAFLLDRLTIREENQPTAGVVNINTRQREPLRALFHNMRIGTNDWYQLTEPDIDNLVDTIIANGPYYKFADMFPQGVWHGGPVGDAFLACLPDGIATNDIIREDAMRKIVNMITFRQNIFIVASVAQYLGLDGQTVLGEERTVATLYRDAYTGVFTTNSVTTDRVNCNRIFVATLGDRTDSAPPFLTWDTAATNLQDALAVAASGAEIWVAEGRYIPGIDRTNHFQLKAGLALYGGFNGTETNLNQRDWRAYPSILSGDINGDDIGFTNNDENVYNVVFNPSTVSNAVIDGFAVTGGNNDSTDMPLSLRAGGGIYGAQSLTVVNCVFRYNHADFGGGGIYNIGTGSAIVENCMFYNNSAGSIGRCSGGAVANYTDASIRFVNCIFSDNSAYSGGGGALYNEGGTATLLACTFDANTAQDAGAIYNAIGASIAATNCIVWNNRATNSAAHQARNGGTLAIGYCNIEGGVTGIVNFFSAEIIDGGGNTEDPPIFLDASDPDGADNIFGTSDDGLRLADGSPCIDSGTNVVDLVTDIEGIPRPLDGNNDGVAKWDMGAYEFVHQDADTDADGMGDADEFVAGTDPTNSESYFSISNLWFESTNTVIIWLTVSNRVYELESTTNLLTGNWTNEPAATNIPGDGSTKTCTNSSADKTKFYRVKVEKK